jgi:chemotaxis protein CheX
MSISFERDTFLGAVSNMFGEEIKAIDESSMDAAGEISNQIYGFAKTELNKRGFAFGLSLPTVVTGGGHSLKHTVPGLCFSTRFQTQDGYLSLEVVLRPTKTN